jgi:septal ring factor EnvC (AmiA/AmiB activator)
VHLTITEGAHMRFARTLAVAAAAAVVSLGVGPIADAALAGKPGDEPCAKQEQQVTKAQVALAHVTAVFEHQKTKVERLQEALAAATTPEETARLQARLDKALAQKQHDQKAKKAQQQRLAKAQARLADCQAARTAPAT